MAINFNSDFSGFIKEINPSFEVVKQNGKQIISFPEKNIQFELISYNEISSPTAKGESESVPGEIPIKIYEDQWNRCRSIIESRVKSKLGMSRKIHARACKIVSLNKNEASDFLTDNHLLGSINCPVKIGLTFKDELVACIGFSKSRVMTDSQTYYRSYELMRFANKNNCTVTGGLNKLLRTFIQIKNVKHIMTYIDLDWGIGSSFEMLGFKEVGMIPPQMFFLDPVNHRRYWENEVQRNNLPQNNLLPVFNSGSRKMVLDLKEN